MAGSLFRNLLLKNQFGNTMNDPNVPTPSGGAVPPGAAISVPSARTPKVIPSSTAASTAGSVPQGLKLDTGGSGEVTPGNFVGPTYTPGDPAVKKRLGEIDAQHQQISAMLANIEALQPQVNNNWARRLGLALNPHYLQQEQMNFLSQKGNLMYPLLQHDEALMEERKQLAAPDPYTSELMGQRAKEQAAEMERYRRTVIAMALPPGVPLTARMQYIENGTGLDSREADPAKIAGNIAAAGKLLGPAGIAAAFAPGTPEYEMAMSAATTAQRTQEIEHPTGFGPYAGFHSYNELFEALQKEDRAQLEDPRGYDMIPTLRQNDVTGMPENVMVKKYKPGYDLSSIRQRSIAMHPGSEKWFPNYATMGPQGDLGSSAIKDTLTKADAVLQERRAKAEAAAQAKVK